ncbi:MAG: lytic murein transglycosylase [Aeromicrobium sp.]|nr:lytic murein transglycosylase [Aeromicrobium sp.]
MVVAVVAVGVVIAATLLLATAALATRSSGIVVAPESGLSVVPVSPAAQVLAPSVSSIRASAAWISNTSAATGIGRVAVRAYGDAALRLAKDQPGCHVGWTTLAGIGGIETGHGTTGGVTLFADGTTSAPILGPALDGSAGMATIRSDAESTQWHGDPQWDHAVGPMQFIPSTWRTWASDGNGDGTADPNNISDAAYATARYLCASGRDLRTGQGWSRAIFSYNHSDDYVRSVLARANQYAAH